MKAFNQHTNTNYPVALIPISRLRPHEMHDPEWARQLRFRICRQGVWTCPLAVTRSGRVVMDGHHRLAAAADLGLVLVPAVLMSYEDGNVELASWRDELVTHDQILNAARTGDLLPPKTTKHLFRPPVGETAISLQILRTTVVGTR